MTTLEISMQLGYYSLSTSIGFSRATPASPPPHTDANIKIKHPHKKYGCLNLFLTCHFQQIVLSYDRDAEVGRFLQFASGFLARDNIRSLFRD